MTVNATDTMWMQTHQQAELEETLEDGIVRCHLSPRQCVIKPGKLGFCRVRGNVDGRLVTYNYGKAVHHTEETIETEAIFHYGPGERILSLGNLGCQMHCDYCHNWATSQARYVKDKDVYTYTPEQVIEIALKHNIRVLSWTYNDPVVWFEFVRDTAALAHKHGIKNLYKSAFFITPEAIEQLLPHIDIFAISVKSMDREYYRKLTKGWLEPVLEGAKLVYQAGKHVEISTLMVTDMSDDTNTARAVAEFVLQDLGPQVPVHFVRFHPDYKMINTIRTPIPRLEAARRTAIEMGVRHVYLGNVYDTDASNTYCYQCGHLQVTRYGLNARIVGLTPQGMCARCGTDAEFKLFSTPAPARPTAADPAQADRLSIARFEWHGDIRSLHVQIKNTAAHDQTVYERRFSATHGPQAWRVYSLQPGESYRFICAKADMDERGVEVAIPSNVQSSLHEVFDRAHFPTMSVESGSLNADVSPFPRFEGNQIRLVPQK